MTADHLTRPVLRQFDPLRAAIEDYLLACQAERRAPKTIVGYRTALTRLARFVGAVEPGALDAATLRRWLRWLQDDGLSATTQRNYLVVVRAWLGWLEAEDGYAVDAAFLRRVKTPTLDTEQPDPLDDAQIRALWSGCSATTWRGVRTRAILAVLLDSGVRASELCGLRLADVDLDEGTIVVRAATSKSRRTRTIALGARARREVGRWWRAKRHAWDQATTAPFFCGWNQRPIGVRTLHRLLVRHGVRCGVPGCNPHRFRHTFAVQCLRAGINPLTLMRLLGHTDLTMTRRYVKLLEADVATEKREKSPLDRLALR